MMALTLIDTLYGLPIGVAALIIQLALLHDKVHSWTSWADTHYDFARVVVVGEEEMRNTPIITSALDLGRWNGVVGTCFFIALFGFTKEARDQYVAWWSAVKRFFKRIGNV